MLRSGLECGRDWSLGIETEDPVLVYTPHDAGLVVNQAIAEEQAAVEELSRAWSEKKISEDQKNSFNAFHNEFHKWLSSVDRPPYSVLKFGLRGIYQEGKRYRERIQDWRDVAKEAGVPSVAPAARRVDTPSEQKKKDEKRAEGGGPWMWGAIAAGGAAAALLIANKIK